jgi:uncharacterized protein DUF4913
MIRNGTDPSAIWITVDEWDRPAEPADPTPATLQYPSAEAWVADWLAVTVRRNVNERRGGRILAWCPRWWAHPEALNRLTGLWATWESTRTAIASGQVEAGLRWWLTYADPTLAVLFDPDHGPFSHCHRDGHRDDLQPLPVIEAP